MPAPLRHALPILLAFGVAAFLLLAHLGAAPLDEAEARSAIVSRHILSSGQWLWPAPPEPFGCDCSPLAYWQAVPFAWAAGGMTELAVRLPSALWALALLFFTWDVARRWHDGLTAALCAGALATSHGFIHWGRHGTAEMAQAATILWCLWYFVKHRSDASRRWLVVLGVLLGLAASFGAREALGVVAFGLVVLSAVAKDWSWLRPARLVILAAVVSIAAFLALPVAASLATGSAEPLRALWREHVLRHLQPPSQAYPLHRDLMGFLGLCAPWVALAPIALAEALGRRREGAGSWRPMLAGGAALAWLMLSSSREPRHLLPLVPLVSIVAGRLLAQFSRRGLAPIASHAVRAAAFLPALAFGGAILFIQYTLRSDHSGPSVGGLWTRVGFWGIAAVGLMAAAMARSGQGMLAAVAVGWVGHLLCSMPLDAAREAERASIAKVRALSKPVAFAGQVPARVAFYLDRFCGVLDGPPDIQTWVTERPGGIVITPHRLDDPSWQRVADGPGWRAVTWNPQARALALTRDPAWLAGHPLRGIESETLAYAFNAEAGLRLNLGTVTMRLYRQEGQDGRELVITAESKGGVPGYPMGSVITSRLREADLGQLDAHDLRSKPSYKHRRFTWLPEGVDYHRHGHCKDKACREPSHMVRRESDGAQVHCAKDGCKQVEHYVWRLREAFRGPNAQGAWHVIAASYIARGLPLAPGAPPQRIRVVNNHQMWDVAIRAVEERAIEVPAGKFQCYRLAFDPTPLNEEARESADEAEGPFGLTGHADLYVDKETKLLVLLDGQIALGATFKVRIQLTRREVVPAPRQERQVR